MTTYKRPLELLEGDSLVKICAPMVRYSKLPFRTLVRNYDCDIAFTPMIVSESFNQSIKARHSDFTTNSGDGPLIVQFAASQAKDFADAAEIVVPYADGVDLNCGCPQKWAMQEGYGCALLKKPELLHDSVLQARQRIDNNDFTISIKIRINSDLKETVELCRRAEKVRASFISVHGRTVDQRTQPVDYEAIKVVKDCVSIPVVANGDLTTLAECQKVRDITGVDGVMSARGILANPAMYAGFDETPLQCLQDWVDISLETGVSFNLFHHHLIYMLENLTCRAEKRLFNSLSSTAAVLDFLREKYDLR
ncbi:hypothetical protein CAPTEDRAFT_112268 [Capitella teleta]|uniref:tRNA-dihydrouridine synthase n=1 Tax=Capitella teleta TaxID=283909 RepID=R7U9W6_CAPTE|nr:hypothetical protein CAPTEDRAFT_112268 [Capitella teleta]|eukprot:ELU03155.1 hypothetical protein CAPTEDRAFT_112268 [Capitella teleta]